MPRPLEPLGPQVLSMPRSDPDTPRPPGVVRRTATRAQQVVETTTGRYEPARYLLLAYQRFRRLNGSILAASIAFRIFLFLVPLTLTLVGAAGFSAASGSDLEDDSSRLGQALASAVAKAGEDSRRSWWVLVVVGAFSMLSRSSAQLWEMWDYQPTPARQRVRFIGGLLLTLAMLLVGRWVRTNLPLGIALQVVSIAVHLGLA